MQTGWTNYKQRNMRTTRFIVVKFEKINLKFEKVRDAHSITTIIGRHSVTWAFNLKKDNRNQNLHAIAETKAENIQIQCIIQCYLRNYLHF